MKNPPLGPQCRIPCAIRTDQHQRPIRWISVRGSPGSSRISHTGAPTVLAYTHPVCPPRNAEGPRPSVRIGARDRVGRSVLGGSLALGGSGGNGGGDRGGGGGGSGDLLGPAHPDQPGRESLVVAVPAAQAEGQARRLADHPAAGR